ncbi:TetR/AcrR family transcriptional regulator [Methanobrevibacter sp.]|uniref:TetR/AcrR family transcriptional regulator n=1 Tax=Methanobrevibacter sp. TaxID=66852 RepID=UPI0038901A48
MFGEKENTEEKIMEATFNILQREGLAKTTTKKIASEAGVNEVTIFRKFENKKNLITATKDFYLKKFTDKLEQNFDYTEDETVDEYLNKSFYGMLEFEEEDAKIVRVALGEVRENPENKLLISQIVEPVFKKLEGFFEMKIEKGEIREINSKAISLVCYSILFQSIMIYQIHHDNPDFKPEFTSEDVLDIIYNGIK